MRPPPNARRTTRRPPIGGPAAARRRVYGGWPIRRGADRTTGGPPTQASAAAMTGWSTNDRRTVFRGLLTSRRWGPRGRPAVRRAVGEPVLRLDLSRLVFAGPGRRPDRDGRRRRRTVAAGQRRSGRGVLR